MNNADLPANCYIPANFYIEVQDRLTAIKPNEYVLISIDLDNFKYINDLFGYEFGDQTLHLLTAYFSQQLKAGELFSRVNADNFIFFMQSIEESALTNRLMNIINMVRCLGASFPAHYNFVTSGGIFLISNPSERLATMLDKANFARKKAKGNHVSTFLHYTKEMSDELQWKKEITLSMEMALNNQEFEMYLQPKILIKSGKVSGAEALVRWNSKKNGMIYPDQFIPVLEQNGFIKKLDFYMLEQACLFLKKCMLEGFPLLPISVNFSKIHVGTPDFVEKVYQIVRQHNIATSLIEIELTESVFSRDFQDLVNIASGLKYLGFKVSLDDFGSAYSSLNYLKDFPADIIKIDKSFLNNSTNTENGRLIIAKIVEMIKSLRLMAVMEGVEDREQVDFLQNLNCDIGQGYFYAKPMPIANYEAFVESKAAELVQSSFIHELPMEALEKEYPKEVPKEFQMDNWELYVLGQNIDMGLMKGYLDGEVTIQYVNKKALDYLGYTPQEFREIFHNKITAFTHPDDIHIIQANAEQLIKTGKPLPFKTRAIRKDGKVIHLEGRSSCITDSQGRIVGLYAFQDVTEELERSNLLQNSLQDKIKEIEMLYDSIPGAVIHCNADKDFSILHHNDSFLRLIGYSKQDLSSIFGNKMINLIVPEDREIVINTMGAQLQSGNHTKFECRIKYQGKFLWILAQGQLTKNEKGCDRFCFVLVDITAEKESREALRRSEERYKIIIDQSDAIMFEWDFTSDTITFSDKYEKVLGLSSTKERSHHSKELFRVIHPDDEAIFKDWMQSTYKKMHTPHFEFRFKTVENNYIWMRSRSSAVCDQNGLPIKAIGVFNNIDQQKVTINYLKQKSQQDSLTKLYNKEETRRYIEKCLATCAPDEKSAMIIVDIDNFKGINDHLGHQFGDTVLVEISEKIKNLFRDTDIVGRLGGDEFVIFMRGITNDTAIYDKASTLTNALRNTYFGENKKYNVSGSIGIAYYPQHATDFKTLYKLADIALYQSKNKGKDCYTIYHDDMADALTDTRTPLESLERFVASYFEDDPIYNIFEMLYETKDMHTTIHMILALAGKRFHVDRAYIFEHSDDGKLSSNTYEWCADGVASEMDTLQNISTADLNDFLAAYNKDGMFYCNDIKTLDPFSYETLNRQGIKSFLHCAISNEGERKGFIGFDDCKQQRVWRSEEIAMLNYISKVLSIFILKKQVSKELWDSYQNHTEMLDNLNGYVYVIDIKTFETLYLNKAMKALDAKVGEKCYKIAFGADAPCENCPARQLSAQTPAVTEEFYSIKIDSWVSSAASRLKWTSKKEAALICCTDITKYKHGEN